MLPNTVLQITKKDLWEMTNTQPTLAWYFVRTYSDDSIHYSLDRAFDTFSANKTRLTEDNYLFVVNPDTNVVFAIKYNDNRTEKYSLYTLAIGNFFEVMKAHNITQDANGNSLEKYFVEYLTEDGINKRLNTVAHKETMHNVTLTDDEKKLLRRALISKETEERSLMQSYAGTNDYMTHFNNVKSIQCLRDKLARC